MVSDGIVCAQGLTDLAVKIEDDSSPHLGLGLLYIIMVLIICLLC